LNSTPAPHMVRGMPSFDPIATPTVRAVPHREPAFVFREQAEYMLSSTSDDGADVHGAGRFTGVTQRYAYPRLFNLYLEPEESWSYLARNLACLEVLREGMRDRLATFQACPPKRLMGLRAPRPGPVAPPA
jgi:hypothetical protein